MVTEPHRHPRCITPPVGSPSVADLTALQTAEIVRLDGLLATARSQLHDANNILTPVLLALELLAGKLGLPATATPREVLAEALRRIR